jgi:hypothetical protein
MEIKTSFRKILSLAGIVATVTLAADLSSAQPRPTPAKRLRSPAVVRGFIGGESHDAYVIRAAKGKTMTVELSWRDEGGNRAGFEVSDMPGFFGVELVKFGKQSDDGKRWTGKIPKTGNYYIYVVAHPDARYILKVSLK